MRGSASSAFWPLVRLPGSVSSPGSSLLPRRSPACWIGGEVGTDNLLKRRTPLQRGMTVRASLDPALKSAGETVGPASASWAGVVGAAAGPAGGPAPGAAPAAGGSGASDGSGGRSRAKSAPKGAEAARRASPVNKDAFELNKPSLIPPKVGAEQASASKGKSKKSLRRILPAPKGAKESRRIILIVSINQVMVFTRYCLCLERW